MSASLVLGDLELIAPYGSPFAVETLAEGTDWGNPQPVEVVFRRLLQGGSIVVHEGDDDREITLRVQITAPDSAALAAGGNALKAELYKPNTLTFTPPDGWGAPTVYVVKASSLAHVMDDLGYVRGEQTWAVRLVCKPFGRSVDAVVPTLTPTTIGTARQKSYTFDAVGSARADLSLHVGATGDLGETLIYTRPGAQGMIPLRQHKTSAGATTVDAGRVSGAYENNIAIDSAPFVAGVPKTEAPDGLYVVMGLVALASGTGDTTLSVAVDTRVDGYATRAAGLSWSVAHEGLSTTYEIRQLTTPFSLPSSLVVDPASAEIRVQIFDASGGVTVRLDEAWLAEIGTGELTWPGTDVLSGGMPAARHIWIEPESVTYPSGAVLRGFGSDQSDAFAAEKYAEGWHAVEPGENHAFLVTTGTTTAALDGSYYPHWFAGAEQ